MFDYQPVDGRPQRRDRALHIFIGTLILLASLWLFILNPLLSFAARNPDYFRTCPEPSPNSTSTTPGTPSSLTVLRSPCGSSPTEARAAGCIFDPNSFVWTHPRCYNAELVAEFLAVRNWTWYADDGLTRELSLQEVMTSEYDMPTVSMGYHVQHCLFMWKLLHHQALGPYGRMGIDSYIGDFNHTAHCAHLVGDMRDVSGEEWNTQIHIKYPDCGVE